MNRAGMRAGLLPDGKRLHLQHGPIDLIVEAFGDPAEVHAAYVQAAAGFVDVLPTLVKELPLLRMPLGDACPLPAGPVAQRMVAACWPHRSTFITPMAAVAGSVADHMLQALLDGRRLDRAYVNDGGDIAFHLAPAQSLTCGLVADLAALAVDGTISLSRLAGTRSCDIWPRHQGTGWAQLLARHRQFRDRPGTRCGRGRCRRDDDHQCRRPARPPCDCP